MLCPICNAEEIEDQPQPSLHAYTLIFKCGTEITAAFSSKESDFIYDQKCNEPRKEKLDFKQLIELFQKSKKIEN